MTTASRRCSTERASAAYVHGLAGAAGEALRTLAIGVIGTGSSMQARVSRYKTSLRLTQTGRPIFPQDMRVVAEATIGSVLSQEFRDYFVGLAAGSAPTAE